MTAIATLTISDGTTPHVFTPVSTAPKAVYSNIADSALPEIGKEQVTIEVIRAKGNGTHRVRTTVKVPVLEIPNGGTSSGLTAAPAVAFTLMSVNDYYIPQRSSPAQRLILRNLSRNLANDAQAIAAIEQLIGPY